jgi:hypothetical protein
MNVKNLFSPAAYSDAFYGNVYGHLKWFWFVDMMKLVDKYNHNRFWNMLNEHTED